MTFTKEWLQQTISEIEAIRDEIPFGLDEHESNMLEVLKLAMASLEAEPALYCMGGDALDEESVSTRKAVVDGWVDEWNGEGRCPGEPQYRTIPLYTAPPAPVSVPDEIQKLKDGRGFRYAKDGVDYSVNYANGWNQCRAALLQGKAEPVSQRYTLPDGYVLVPVKPTPEMLRAIMEANQNQRGSLATYSRLLAAAPQQEVSNG